MHVLGLDHVQVAAPPGCEAAARRFYGELVGLAEMPKPEPSGQLGTHRGRAYTVPGTV